LNDVDPDEVLMRRIARGDPGAVRQMTVIAVPRLHAFAARILRDRSEAEDVVQETVVRAVRQAPRWIAGNGRIDTWLHTVALNLCRDRLRRLRKELPTAKVPDQADTAPGPETVLLETERSQRVADAVHGLPERQREAILLVHYQELSGAEAAGILGISIEALESLLARGRRSLKEQFSKQEKDND
jgi:RNA polymerase sigma-70 factor, ECF subfamily